MKKISSLFMIMIFIVGLFPVSVVAVDPPDPNQVVLDNFLSNYGEGQTITIDGESRTIADVVEVGGQTYYSLTTPTGVAVSYAVYSAPDSTGDPIIRLQEAGTENVFSTSEENIALYGFGSDHVFDEDGSPTILTDTSPTLAQIHATQVVQENLETIGRWETEISGWEADLGSVNEQIETLEANIATLEANDPDNPSIAAAQDQLDDLQIRKETLESNIIVQEGFIEDQTEELNEAREAALAAGTPVTAVIDPTQTPQEIALDLNQQLQQATADLETAQLQDRTEYTADLLAAQNTADEQLNLISAQLSIAELDGSGDIGVDFFNDIVFDPFRDKQEKRDALRALLDSDTTLDQAAKDAILANFEEYLNAEANIRVNTDRLAALDDDIESSLGDLIQQRNNAVLAAYPSIDPILLDFDFSAPGALEAFNQATSEDLGALAQLYTEEQLEAAILGIGEEGLEEGDIFGIGSALADLQTELSILEQQISPAEQTELERLREENPEITIQEAAELDDLRDEFDADRLEELGAENLADIDRTKLTPAEIERLDRLLELQEEQREENLLAELEAKAENGELSEEDEARMENLRRQIALRQAERAKEIENIQNSAFGLTVLNALAFMKTFLGWYNRFSGLGKVASLFITDDDIYGIKDEVHDIFCKSVLFGDPSCRFQWLCEKHPDHMSGGNIILSNVNNRFQAGAHLQAYIYPPSLSVEDELPTLDDINAPPKLLSNEEFREQLRLQRLRRRQKPERMYLATYSVSLQEKDDDDNYNLVFYGPDGIQYKLFRNPKAIKSGESDSRGPRNPFIQSSKRVYEKACLEFSNGIIDFRGDRHRKLCVPIVLKSGEAPRTVQNRANQNTAQTPPGEQSGF